MARWVIESDYCAQSAGPQAEIVSSDAYPKLVSPVVDADADSTRSSAIGPTTQNRMNAAPSIRKAFAPLGDAGN
jgi:hypothetical protein